MRPDHAESDEWEIDEEIHTRGCSINTCLRELVVPGREAGAKYLGGAVVPRRGGGVEVPQGERGLQRTYSTP